MQYGRCAGKASALCFALWFCACGDSDGSLGGTGWGEEVFLTDEARELQLGRDTLWVEEGATVHGKVRGGRVSMRSSDASVFEVGSLEERAVGTVCDEDGLSCRPDLETRFTLRALSSGTANVLVEREGDSVALTLRVAASVGAEVLSRNGGEIWNTVRIFQRGSRFRVRLLVRDADGNPLITHATWTLERTDSARFVIEEVPANSDVFVNATEARFEGPFPSIEGLANGQTGLSIQTSGGRVSRSGVLVMLHP